MKSLFSKILVSGMTALSLNACGQAPTAPKAEGTAPVSGKEKTTIAPINGPVVFHSDEYNAVRGSFREPRGKIETLCSRLDKDNPDLAKALLLHKRTRALPGRVAALLFQGDMIESCALDTNAPALRIYTASVYHVMKINQDFQGRFAGDSHSLHIPALKPIGTACADASHALSQILEKDLSEKLSNLGLNLAAFKEQMKMPPDNPLIMETTFLAPVKAAMSNDLKGHYESVIASVKPIAAMTKQLQKDCERRHIETQERAYSILASTLDDQPVHAITESTLVAALAVCADDAHRTEAFRTAHRVLAASIINCEHTITAYGQKPILNSVSPELAMKARQLSADIAALKGKLEEMQQYFAE